MKTALIWTAVILMFPLLYVLSFIVERYGFADDDGKPLPVRHW
jgi:hypothetical protein